MTLRLDKQTKSEIVFYIMFFMPLLGTVIYSYVFVLFFFLFTFLFKPKDITSTGIILGIVVVFYCALKYFQMGDLVNWSIIVRYYFGWTLMLYYLSYTRFKFENLDRLLWFLSIEILIEGLLINTIISPSLLLNYPHQDSIDFDSVIASMGFERPYSIGNNATVTSTILCMLLALRFSFKKDVLNARPQKDWLEIVSAAAMLMLASGTGLIQYFIYLLYKNRKLWSIRSLLSVVLFIFVFLFILNSTPIGDFVIKRFGAEALDKMYYFKMNQIEDFKFLMKGQSILLGLDFHDIPVLTQGDIAWVEAFCCIGLLGVSIIVFFIFSHFNRVNRFALIIGIIGAIHYGGIFSEPGQLILAYIALQKKDSNKKNIINKYV